MEESLTFNSSLSFEEIIDNNNIIIFSDRNGRKQNTYIVDWNISKEDKKTHLKNLKKKHGCNGTLKNKNFQGEDKFVIHLQGDLKDEVKNYLIENGLDEENIEVKE